MMMFKVGEKVLCDAELATIESVCEDRVTCVRTDGFMHGGYSLRVVKLNAVRQAFSACCSCLKKELHRGYPHLNFPDVIDHINQMWYDGCQAGELTEYMNRIDKFVEKVEELHHKAESFGVDGIAVIRPVIRSNKEED